MLSVLYLIFNEGYTLTSGNMLLRIELCDEAIRLVRVLVQLLTQEPLLDMLPEALGLLALMLLHDARRDARLGPEGFYYDTELKMIPALKPRLAFVPNVGMLKGVFEDKETSELLVTIHWSQRNRQATNHRSHLALIPIEKLFNSRDDLLVYTPKSSSDYVQSDNPFEQALANPVVISSPQHRPAPEKPQRKIPVTEWSNVVRRVVENREPLRKVAEDYRVSHETIRRTVRIASKQRMNTEAPKPRFASVPVR
ncbi:hypothetical protein KSC_030670 [Ktedonobacter sp. SOSP1-52]|nr:hypothetical protein KSC_030670 [Ktedonobacter sp. SOSP1-52]